jgi:hypothetical protein
VVVVDAVSAATYGPRMRRRLLGLLGLLTCVVAISVLQVGPSRAQSGHASKDTGDAPAAIDITGIDANNATRRVKVRLLVPGLSDQGTFTISYESDRYDGMAIVVRLRASGVTSQAWHCDEETCHKVRCPGAKVQWNLAEKYVGASVPQSCYPLDVPRAWNFNGHADLGDDYDSAYTRLRLRRG